MKTTVTATAAALSISQFLTRAERADLRRIASYALRMAVSTARALAEVMASLLVLSVVLCVKVVNPVRRAVAWILHTCSSVPRIYRAELRTVYAVAVWCERHPIATNTLLFALTAALAIEVIFSVLG